MGACIDFVESEPVRMPIIIGLLGVWPSLTGRGPELQSEAWFITRCPQDAAGLAERIERLKPSWLILGNGLAEQPLIRLAALAQVAHQRIKLAVLGDDQDLERCDRWLARGANIYLRWSIELEHVLKVIAFTEYTGLDVIDGSFRILRMARRALLAEDASGEHSGLTQRELQVLRLVRLGMRNSSIAVSLNIAESTVEFHMSNILRKLGARSRTEAAQCANALAVI